MKNFAELHVQGKPGEKRTIIENAFSKRTVTPEAIELKPYDWFQEVTANATVPFGVNHTTRSGISALLDRKEGVSNDDKHSGKDRRTETGSVGRRQAPNSLAAFRGPERRWAIRETVFIGSKNFTNKVTKKPLWASAARNCSRNPGSGPKASLMGASAERCHGVVGYAVDPRNDPEITKTRPKALEARAAQDAQDGLLPTEEQIAAPEKAKRHKVAHGELESHRPGYPGSQNTCEAGTMKGAGRI